MQASVDFSLCWDSECKQVLTFHSDTGSITRISVLVVKTWKYLRCGLDGPGLDSQKGQDIWFFKSPDLL